jgi:hypothetical protein
LHSDRGGDAERPTSAAHGLILECQV